MVIDDAFFVLFRFVTSTQMIRYVSNVLFVATIQKIHVMVLCHTTPHHTTLHYTIHVPHTQRYDVPLLA